MYSPHYEQIYNELKEDQYMVDKYEHAGIYHISLNNYVIYIGKSRNMLQRIASHIANIKDDKANKYQIMKQAIKRGYDIEFGVLYYSPYKEQGEIDIDIGYQEALQIYLFKEPILNQQIPSIYNWKSYHVNKRAQTITLDEVLEEIENNRNLMVKELEAKS